MTNRHYPGRLRIRAAATALLTGLFPQPTPTRKNLPNHRIGWRQGPAGGVDEASAKDAENGRAFAGSPRVATIAESPLPRWSRPSTRFLTVG